MTASPFALVIHKVAVAYSQTPINLLKEYSLAQISFMGDLVDRDSKFKSIYEISSNLNKCPYEVSNGLKFDMINSCPFGFFTKKCSFDKHKLSTRRYKCNCNPEKLTNRELDNILDAYTFEIKVNSKEDLKEQSSFEES